MSFRKGDLIVLKDGTDSDFVGEIVQVRARYYVYNIYRRGKLESSKHIYDKEEIDALCRALTKLERSLR